MRKWLVGLALSAVALFGAVDLNKASKEELVAIKGIGDKKAEAIIEYRTKNGNFKTVDELEKVKGFGAKSVETLKGELTVGETKAEPKKDTKKQ